MKSNKGFIAVDFKALREKRHFPDFGTEGQAKTFFALLAFCQEDNHIRVTPGDLAERLRCTLKDVLEAITMLRDHEVITQCDVADFMIDPDIAYVGERTDEKQREFKQFHDAEKALMKQFKPATPLKAPVFHGKEYGK